ncbi:MAG: sensor histidine kinase [Solirubrobacteraceae bacterium]
MRFRTRLLAVSLATLALGLGLLLVLGNILLAGTVDGDTSRLLATRADAQIAALSVTPAGVSVRHAVNDETLDAHAWIFDRGRLIERPSDVPAALDRVAVSLGARAARGDTDGPGDVRLRSVPLIAAGSRRVVGGIVVEVSTTPFHDLQRKVLVGSLAVALLILLAGAVAVGRALHGALDPVRRMTTDAEDWGEHDLDRRFALGPARDEITGLAATLDHLLERIAASRRHERRFAADVAHELRTPLAAIRGRVELALDPRAPSEDAHATLRAIEAQVARMSATVDTLLAVARRETDPQDGRVDLQAIAQELEGVEVRVLTDPMPAAEGDPEIVRRALAPLLDNARRHARSSVTITLDSTLGHARITVHDDGPGLDPDLGEAAFEPGLRGDGEPDGGAGLGLPLARRLARACGGEVFIGAGPGGCFVLELPAVDDELRPARLG